eukprot:TRINITY_DN5644_c0_g2_i2.p1 TRINITY_DN5644_c0_g2~~TRINITY_DN5644_c0_g2_i2.p1  ORF type:complete len:603 (-),score=154.17 TRINITY_DN5644_c0_g2_i2:284-2092(-)
MYKKKKAEKYSRIVVIFEWLERKWMEMKDEDKGEDVFQLQKITKLAILGAKAVGDHAKQIKFWKILLHKTLPFPELDHHLCFAMIDCYLILRRDDLASKMLHFINLMQPALLESHLEKWKRVWLSLNNYDLPFTIFRRVLARNAGVKILEKALDSFEKILHPPLLAESEYDVLYYLRLYNVKLNSKMYNQLLLYYIHRSNFAKATLLLNEMEEIKKKPARAVYYSITRYLPNSFMKSTQEVESDVENEFGDEDLLKSLIMTPLLKRYQVIREYLSDDFENAPQEELLMSFEQLSTKDDLLQKKVDDIILTLLKRFSLYFFNLDMTLCRDSLSRDYLSIEESWDELRHDTIMPTSSTSSLGVSRGSSEINNTPQTIPTRQHVDPQIYSQPPITRKKKDKKREISRKEWWWGDPRASCLIFSFNYVLEIAKKKGIQIQIPHLYLIFNTFLFQRDFKSCIKLLDLNGSTTWCFSIPFLKLFCRDDVRAALSWFLKFPHKKNWVQYRPLMYHLYLSGLFKGVIALWHDMVKNGIEPTTSMYRKVLSSLIRLDSSKAAFLLLNSLKENNHPQVDHLLIAVKQYLQQKQKKGRKFRILVHSEKTKVFK